MSLPRPWPARLLNLLSLLLLCLFLSPQSASAELEGSENEFGSYTSEELTAMEQALNAGNMTLEDLKFDKDYAQGYECFPIIREMMNDPLKIAAWMDETALSCRVPWPMGDYERRIFNEKFPDSSADLRSFLSRVSRASFQARVEREWTLKSGSELEYLNKFGYQDREHALKDEHSRTLDELSGIAGFTGTAEEFTDHLEDMLNQHSLGTSGTDAQPVSPAILPSLMTWHKIFADDDPAGEVDTLSTYEQLSVLHTQRNDEAFDLDLRLLALLWETINADGRDYQSLSFPQDRPLIRDTEYGRICLGTYSDDHYKGDFTILIDPGGNDTYTNCRIGAATGEPSPELGNGQIGIFMDLGGDDFYDCYDVDFTLGATVLGNAAFYDLGGGNDRYYAGSCTLGAAMAGVATFYDDGGSDTYKSKIFTQGAAAFGIGIMLDDAQGDAPEFDIAEGNEEEIDAHERDSSQPDILASVDNDTYSAWSMAQAFARTRGVALCINTRGNEIYEAGGVYLHAPLFGDCYQSFSQGFAIGERDIDYAGGIAMLIDHAGNDRYLGDIYNQGVGYWYSGGFLWDGAGNDLYEMTQYGQGSGIHLAVGGLVDVSGSDTYVMHSGLGQGGSHDYAASILHDRAGDDRYFGNTSCNGCGLTNSVGIHLDRSGNDTYASRKDGGLNSGRPARNSASIGLLVDLAGTDSYLADGNQADSSMWSNSQYGVGWDIAPPPDAEETASSSGPNQPPGEDVEMPEIIAYEGELTQEVFDELWEIAIRWEVGENVAIVPEARDRIVAFGMPVLPYVVAEMDDDYSLAVRAFNEIYPQLMELDRQSVLDAIRAASESDVHTQRNCVLRVIGDLKLLELEDVVTGYFDDPLLRRRAIGVVGMIGSHNADAELLAMLRDPATDEKDLQAAIVSAASLELDCAAELMDLMQMRPINVRDCASGQLKAHWDVYGEQVLSQSRLDCVANSAQSNEPKQPGFGSIRRLRCLLSMQVGLEREPEAADVRALELVTDNPSWGLRADSIALLLHWYGMELNGELRSKLDTQYDTVSQRMETEIHPYVLNVWQQGQ